MLLPTAQGEAITAATAVVVVAPSGEIAVKLPRVAIAVPSVTMSPHRLPLPLLPRLLLLPLLAQQQGQQG